MSGLGRREWVGPARADWDVLVLGQFFALWAGRSVPHHAMVWQGERERVHGSPVSLFNFTSGCAFVIPLKSVKASSNTCMVLFTFILPKIVGFDSFNY
jgi:hypothetical protein